jgi:flavodoxin
LKKTRVRIMKTLILFYSRTGKTKFVAEMIAKQLNAETEELVDKTDRRGIKGWIISGRDAMRKRSTEIAPLGKDIRKYDTILIGQPVWGWAMVPAVRGLCQKYDFAGKKVALFCTMDGSGDKGCFEETTKLIPKAKIVGMQAFLKPRKDEKKAAEIAELFTKKIAAGAAPKAAKKSTTGKKKTK